MGIFDPFSKGGGEAGKAYDEASKIYEEQSKQIIDEIMKSRAEGRTDITGGYERALGYQKPYTQAGEQSLSALLESLGIGQGARGEQGVYEKFSQSPAYKYALEQGLKASKAGAAARGMSGSGAEMLELQKVGSGLASSNWEQYLKNYQDRLASAAGMGQTAAGVSSQLASGEGAGLADLGFRYSSMSTEARAALAKAMAEAKMAKGAMLEQQTSDIWGAAGSAIGGWAGRKK